ncbi:MAG: DUF3037 domain-containing protein [Ardenticatenaceae bacterium]|nr:DUF3037 domain-containing protein [Ardenticatenaceae bacterium]HBY97378.1 DUF3037 domain-containing protein [Chloroflexota bacterium]
MPGPIWYDYALIRVVPRVEREEFVNVGAVLYAPAANYLGIRMAPDWDRVRTIGPDLDLDLVRRYLDALVAISEGHPDAGPIAHLSQSERFHWLTSPKSSIIQVSPVHSGQCHSPEQALDSLVDKLVTLRTGSP